MVGNQRLYGEDTIRRLRNTSSAKYLGLRPPQTPTKAASGRTTSVSVGSAPGRTHRRLSVPGSLTFVEPSVQDGTIGGAVAPSIHGVGSTGTSVGTIKSTGLLPLTQREESFVGKMRGLSSENSSTAQKAVAEQSSSVQNLSKRQKRSCLSRNLDHILGEPK